MLGDETQNAGHSVLYREVSMVTAVLPESGQPASLEQVCWGFLINKLSNRKGVIGPNVPAEEEITFLEVGPE